LRPREEQALVELGTTRFARGTRLLLIGVFLAIIATVPLFESIADYRSNIQTRKTMLASGGPLSLMPGRRPRFFNVFGLFPSVGDVFAARGPRQWKRLLPTPKALRAFEDDLLLKSAFGKQVRPWAQWMLTRWLGTGSQKVLYGSDRWLYYSDGVQYVVGDGFLDSSQLARRANEGFDPDPRPAIIQLHNELKALGITLVVLPVPDKAVVRPASLSRSQSFDRPVQNASWDAFAADLRRHGVLFLDLAQAMFDAERGGAPQFIRGDSHWSAAGIDVAAKALAQLLTSQTGAALIYPKRYERRGGQVDHVNDLVILLDLPSSRANAFGLHEVVPVQQVIDSAGQPWHPDSASGILLIGDSFLEAFSTGPAPVAAGLAEQVSYYLQQSVDRTAGHVFDALYVRQPLGASLGELRQRTRGRKVIVMEFAMRTLAVANWPVLH
jgi:hypothetical protein